MLSDPVLVQYCNRLCGYKYSYYKPGQGGNPPVDPPIITPAYEYRTDASLYGTKDSAQEDTVKSFRTVRVRVVGPYGQRLATACSSFYEYNTSIKPGGKPPCGPPYTFIKPGGKPPLGPPYTSLSQGGHPPVDPPPVHILYEYRTVLYGRHIRRTGTVRYCTVASCAALRLHAMASNNTSYIVYNYEYEK